MLELGFYISMAFISSIIFYTLVFLAVYVQVFFLVTFLENRKSLGIRSANIKLRRYPAVTVIVPCYNEETTIYQTVRSLLALNYPKDKLKIFLINDGSTDGTLRVMQKFAKYSNIKVLDKENGGKHTALNLGLEHLDTPFMACLDADSFVHPEALVRIMTYFEADPNTMAVAPSIIAHNPQTILQNAQKAEYHMSVYFKKMLGILGGIHVTPGPFTVFRKRVFEDLGGYVEAHNTEDMEIAYRMQKHHYKIEHCHDAYAYTSTPLTVKKLFKQRLRWIYGFINNTIDYRKIILRKKYGNFSLFTVPSGVVSVIAVSFLFGRVAYNLGEFTYSKVVEYSTIGFSLSNKLEGFDLFFINTQSFIFVTVFVYFFVILSMVLGKKMSEGKWGLSLDMLYFMSIFTVVAPFWLMKAIYNTILAKKPAWR